MNLTLRWSIAVCMFICSRAVFFTCSQSSSAEASLLSVKAVPSKIEEESTCGEWTSWAPPRTDPAVVLQVVSEDYADVEKNFIRLMEINSAFTRQHLFLICLDDASADIFESLGIRCVPGQSLRSHSHHSMWKIRVRALSCLVTDGYSVIMSDSDALWLRDPMEYIGWPAVNGSSVFASRGSFPRSLGKKWGSTICMGFIMFFATGAGMNTFQNAMEHLVLETGDDQIAVNRAAFELGITWDKDSDMRYESSTDVGKGTIADLSTDNGELFEIILFPHNMFTRVCDETPVSNDTVVAHCHTEKNAAAKLGWMKDLNLWSPDGISP